MEKIMSIMSWFKKMFQPSTSVQAKSPAADTTVKTTSKSRGRPKGSTNKKAKKAPAGKSSGSKRSTQAKARARTAKGKFKADDPSTPDVNEAWVSGKAPAKKKRTYKKKK